MTDIFLHPGDLRFAGAGARIRTLLGSCLAIVMWHPVLRIGGMSHCLLPSRSAGDRGFPLDGRYVDEALPLLLAAAARHDTDPADYHIKLFGGSTMIAALHDAKHASIGDLNIRQALLRLSLLDLPVAARDLGGIGYRSVVFEVGSGDVWVGSGQEPSREPVTEAVLT